MKHLVTRELIDRASRALDADPPPFAMTLCGTAMPMADLTCVYERTDCPRCRDIGALEHHLGMPLTNDVAEAANATVDIEGAEAAARFLNVSGRTVRRWLSRCPPQKWPAGSRPGQRPPVWLDEAELQQWWATRRRWALSKKRPLEEHPTKKPFPTLTPNQRSRPTQKTSPRRIMFCPPSFLSHPNPT